MHTSLLLYSFHLAVNKKVPIYINTAFKEYLSYSQFHSHCLSPDGEIPDRNNLLTTGSSQKLSHLTLIGSKFDHIISLQTLGTMLMHACTQKQYNGNYRHDQETLKQLKLVKRKKAKVRINKRVRKQHSFRQTREKEEIPAPKKVSMYQ